MVIKKENIKVANLLQQLSNAKETSLYIQDEGYIQEVKDKLPAMEEALNDLKIYLKEIEKNQCSLVHKARNDFLLTCNREQATEN